MPTSPKGDYSVPLGPGKLAGTAVAAECADPPGPRGRVGMEPACSMYFMYSMCVFLVFDVFDVSGGLVAPACPLYLMGAGLGTETGRLPDAAATARWPGRHLRGL